jgi:glucan phosphoethanolaminetransferase (alkaline phosphatase superfamily)
MLCAVGSGSDAALYTSGILLCVFGAISTGTSILALILSNLPLGILFSPLQALFYVIVDSLAIGSGGMLASVPEIDPDDARHKVGVCLLSYGIIITAMEVLALWSLGYFYIYAQAFAKPIAYLLLIASGVAFVRPTGGKDGSVTVSGFWKEGDEI